jgi:hypothetical protein
MTDHTALTAAEIRLGQYADRSTWSNATYNDGTEKALHEIALGLKAEVDRLRAELARQERLHGDTIDDRDRAQDAADKLAYAVASEDVIGEHTADNSPWANALGLITSKAEVDRLRARTLTASEYNTAWHAIEGAAGEEGADPGTVLHAVLDRLGINWQDAAAPHQAGRS